MKRGGAQRRGVLVASTIPSNGLDALDPDELADDLTVIEGHYRIGKLLVSLMTLARDEQAVAGLRLIQRDADRVAAVLDEGDLGGVRNARLHVSENLPDGLVARI